MFGFNEKISDSFVAAIKESFQSGTPIIHLIAQIDEYKDKGIVEWYAIDKGNNGVTFKLAGTDRRFRLGEKGLAPVNAVPPENPETVNAPPHIRKATAERKCMAPACSCQEDHSPQARQNPWHHIFGDLKACVDCGAILGRGKTRCRYCEDKNLPLEKLEEALKKPTENRDKLDACPVCGHYGMFLTSAGGTAVVTCPVCSVRSQICHAPEEAIESWNRRSHLNYDMYLPNPCPICGGASVVDVKYPVNLSGLIISRIICGNKGCIVLKDDGVDPHIGVIPKWQKLTATFDGAPSFDACEEDC